MIGVGVTPNRSFSRQFQTKALSYQHQVTRALITEALQSSDFIYHGTGI